MPLPQSQPVIFTDLDGTMLAHEDYRFDAVLAYLPSIITDMPVVPATSKTLAEVLRWRQILGLKGPFMVENGSAVYLPGQSGHPSAQVNGRTFTPSPAGAYSIYRLGTTLDELLAFLDPWADRLINFVTCTVDTAAELTGLAHDDAAAAQQRSFSVPLMVEDSSLEQEIISASRQAGFTCLQGGRFLHLQGACDKGLALSLLRAVMEIENKIPHHAIALGDSDNDRRMLEAADIAIVVNNPASAPMTIDHPAVFYTRASAPEGWVEGIETALNYLHNTTGDTNG